MKKEYKKLVNSIGRILEKGRNNAVYSVNRILLDTYWEIGKQIVEYEQLGIRSSYGSNLLKNISSDLNQKGFSIDNLENMRKFYLKFKKSETLSRKLTWSHYVELLKIYNSLEESKDLNSTTGCTI